MQFLKDKNILIGVTGSIAAYKALELVRYFIKAGANVRVIMSENAKKFIAPLSFEALSLNEVLHSETESWSNSQNHIQINKWADVFVIAPITANSINKLASGISDNLITSTALAFTKPIIIAPAANTAMFLHVTTQNSLKKLHSFGYKIINTQDKTLACGIKGVGALANVKNIFYSTTKILLKDNFWSNKKVLITGGGTIEKIDDVRYISNFSSGKMADNLCLALFLSGARITFIKTYENENEILPITYLHVKSAKEMQEKLKENIDEYDFLFMVAAVSDYAPKATKGKLKKDVLGDVFNLELFKNRDLLLDIKDKNLIKIGFKAELEKKDALKNAQKMLKDKNLNAVCLNIIDNNNNFGDDNNTITFITNNVNIDLTKKPKLDISFEIINEIRKGL